MNVKKIVGKYHRSLVINPLIAGPLAMLVLSVNTILPAFISLFSEQTAIRMEESVELISVYGLHRNTVCIHRCRCSIRFGPTNSPTVLAREQRVIQFTNCFVKFVCLNYQSSTVFVSRY